MTSHWFPPHSLLFESFPKEKIKLTLSELLTLERKERIAQVVEGRTAHMIPVMENLYDRGNISAAMRSAEAFGFLNFHIVQAPDSRFKSANRVTQGADKWLNVTEFKTTPDCVKSLKEQNFKIYATHLEASRPIEQINFSQPTALVFGNEKDGVSKEMLDLVDGSVIIPMQGFSQSFNISVAAAISFYHIYRDRVQRLGKSGDLTEEEKQDLILHYYIKSIGYERVETILKNTNYIN